jgi:hypothetical protein
MIFHIFARARIAVPSEGVNTMRMPSRLFSMSLLVTASLLPGVWAPATAQHDHSNMVMPAQEPVGTMKLSRWSDPKSWPNGKVPGAGDAVTIARDQSMILDVSPPALRSLTVSGKLSFSNDRDISLTTDWIYLAGGELEIGTKAKPHTRNAVITLTDKVPNENINTMGDRGIMMLRGTLNMHGDRHHTWTKLAKTAKAGSSKIEVLNAAGWRKGDEIVLASTDYDARQAEKRKVAAVNGNTLTLDKPLKYMHFGEFTFGVDQRGEVAMLSRNIKVQASEDAAKSYFGGHIMAMAGSKMFVEGVELTRMGQHMTLARYPIHWHLVGDEGKGQYVRNAAIHDTFNRCVTVHGTNNLKVENNVTYNNVGHCFFLEDGIERGNEFIKNLAIQTKCHPTLDCVPTNLGANAELRQFPDRASHRKASFHSGNTLLPSDNTVASFWITNPDNSYIDNVAAGADANGFWLSLPLHPNGEFLGTAASLNTWPRRTPMRAFRGNVAHSNFDGFMFDRNINEDNTFGLTGNALMPLKDPTDPNSEMVETHFENLTSYKNRNSGIWARGELFVFRDTKLADNAIGMTQASGAFRSKEFTSRLVDSLVVGDSGNVGNPKTREELSLGRSLPKPSIPDFPTRGFEYYDYRNEVLNTKFVNYQDNAVRKTGALSWLLFTSSGVTTASTVEKSEFVNAKPAYFPKIDPRFDNDNRGGVAYRTLSIHDLDGSATGIPNSHILLHDGENDSVATDDSCVIKPTWNASVCEGDVGRLYLTELSASRGGTGPRLGLEPRPEKPIALVRKGKEFRITDNQSTVRAGTEIQVKTERDQVTFALSEMNHQSWVIFEVPGFTKAAAGRAQPSLDALRKANDTSYFKDANSLWVKLVVADKPLLPLSPLDMQATIAVSR